VALDRSIQVGQDIVADRALDRSLQVMKRGLMASWAPAFSLQGRERIQVTAWALDVILQEI